MDLILKFFASSTRLLLLLGSLLLLPDCSDSGTEIPTIEGECSASSIEEILECPIIPNPVSTPVVTRSEPEITDFDFSNNLICEQIEVNATGATGEYRSLNPNTDVIFPGNLLQYSTITQGTPNEIAVPRAGGTVTIDLLNGSDTSGVYVDEVNFNEVTDAINLIIGGNNGLLPADFTYTEQQVRSKNELAVNLGVDVNSLQGSFATQMSFSNDREYNRMVVELVQKYYTVVFDTPTSTDEVFTPSVTAADLEPFIGPNEPPVFIKSVTYGRQFYLLIESTSSATELEATVSANFTAGLANTDLEAGVKNINELSEVNVKAFALGGDAGSALSAVTAPFDSLRVFLNRGGTIETGKPLSYKMKSIVAPYQDVGVNVATNFTINNCRPAYSIQPPAFTTAWFEVFGMEGIGAACSANPNTAQTILINQVGDPFSLLLTLGTDLLLPTHLTG